MGGVIANLRFRLRAAVPAATPEFRSTGETKDKMRATPGTSVGEIRPSAVVILAFALLIGGVLLAVESMSVEDQMRTHYEDALALSHLALETQQASAQLRNDQLRIARGVGTDDVACSRARYDAAASCRG